MTQYTLVCWGLFGYFWSSTLTADIHSARDSSTRSQPNGQNDKVPHEALLSHGVMGDKITVEEDGEDTMRHTSVM